MKKHIVARSLWMSLSGLILLGSLNASAFTRQDFDDNVDPLMAQMKRVSRLTAPSCPANFTKILGPVSKPLKVSLFFGYEDFDGTTADAVQSASMVYMLKRKCETNVEACGFTQVEQRKNFSRLEKVIDGQQVIIDVQSTSITESDVRNRDGLDLYAKQEDASTAVRAKFYDALVKSDVVFYNGHSRIGAGLGFNSQSALEEGINYIFRMPLKPILNALGTRPSNLKLLGLFSCSSEDYYRADIERVNSSVSLILSKDELEYDEAPQALYGALNALFTRKCAQDFKESLVTAGAPKHRAINLIRK